MQLLLHLFGGGQLGSDCQDAADADDNGRLEPTDALLILHYLFLKGPPPSSPYVGCGLDETQDELACAAFPACELCDNIAGDGFFYVIDRSGGFTGSGGLAIAKREVGRNVEQFSCFVQFGLVFFDQGVITFPAGKPERATEANRLAAKDFIDSTPGGSGSCVQAGLLAAFDFAEQSTAARNVIIYFGDGGATCPGADEAAYRDETLAAVRDRNQGRVQVNTIGVGPLGALDEAFLKALAAENGGTFARIVR